MLIITIEDNRMLKYIFMQARQFLSKLGNLSQTQIFAKIESVEVGRC